MTRQLIVKYLVPYITYICIHNPMPWHALLRTIQGNLSM